MIGARGKPRTNSKRQRPCRAHAVCDRVQAGFMPEGGDGNGQFTGMKRSHSRARSGAEGSDVPLTDACISQAPCPAFHLCSPQQVHGPGAILSAARWPQVLDACVQRVGEGVGACVCPALFSWSVPARFQHPTTPEE